MPASRSKAEMLVDAPSSQLDRLAELNALLEQREKELDDAQHTLSLLQARILSEKSQWMQQKADEERELALKAHRLNEVWTAKLQEAEQQVRDAEHSLLIQKDMEREAERRIEEIARKEQAIVDLSKERLEIEMLRRQVQARSDEVESRWSASQDALVKGQDAILHSQKALEEVEARNLRLNELETAIRQREDAVLIREKQIDLANQELDRKLAHYVTVKAQEEEAPPPIPSEPEPSEPEPSEPPTEPPIEPQPEEEPNGEPSGESQEAV